MTLMLLSTTLLYSGTNDTNVVKYNIVIQWDEWQGLF